MAALSRTPICIVGAGRSGTNLLTFIFAAESADFVNLGENRYVWSYGQKRSSTDRRLAEDVTPEISNYIRTHFEKRRPSDQAILLDKTPSNAFRIPFIAAIYEDVKFIHIIRDGRENILSRTRQWKAQEPSEDASFNAMSSLAGKLRFLSSRTGHMRRLVRSGSLPVDRVPTMLRDTLSNNLHVVFAGRAPRYGERIPGMSELLKCEGVDAAAAIQWRETVMAARTDGARLAPDRYLELRYENLLADPIDEWHRILAFLGKEPTGNGDRHLKKILRKQADSPHGMPEARARIERVERYIRPTLEHLGYKWHP